MEGLTFANDLTFLYIGTPGHWLLMAYCFYLQVKRLKQRPPHGRPRAAWETFVAPVIADGIRTFVQTPQAAQPNPVWRERMRVASGRLRAATFS